MLRTFKWHNEAKGNAAVHCVIIGFHACGGDFSNAEKAEFGRRGEEETASASSVSSSASPRLSNLRVKESRDEIAAAAHARIDALVDKAYGRSFSSGSDRVAHLFRLYAEKTTMRI